MRAWLLLLLLLTGCGYSTGFTLPGGRTTVGVEFFGNDSRLRNLEADLHLYITDATNRLVHARIVPPDEADYVVRGTIRSFARRKGIRSPDNVRLETGLRIGVRAQLYERDVLAGDRELKLVHDNAFSSQSGYRLEEPRGEEDAQDRVLRNLADEIVLDMFSFLAARDAP